MNLLSTVKNEKFCKLRYNSQSASEPCPVDESKRQGTLCVMAGAHSEQTDNKNISNKKV